MTEPKYTRKDLITGEVVEVTAEEYEKEYEEVLRRYGVEPLPGLCAPTIWRNDKC